MSQPDHPVQAQTDAAPAEPGNEERRSPAQAQSCLDKARTAVASALRGIAFPAHYFSVPPVSAMPKWRKRDELLADPGDIGFGNESGFMGDARGDAVVSLRNASPVAREAATGVKQRVRDLAGRSVLQSGGPQRSWWAILSGAAVIDALFKPKKTPKDDSSRDGKSPERQDRDADGNPENAVQTAPGAAVIPGIGDRRSDLAMTALPGMPRLRPATPKKGSTVNAPRPKSRLECGKRCGRDGFCDPSNPLGCGGIYCGKQGGRTD